MACSKVCSMCFLFIQKINFTLQCIGLCVKYILDSSKLHPIRSDEHSEWVTCWGALVCKLLCHINMSVTGMLVCNQIKMHTACTNRLSNCDKKISIVKSKTCGKKQLGIEIIYIHYLYKWYIKLQMMWGEKLVNWPFHSLTFCFGQQLETRFSSRSDSGNSNANIAIPQVCIKCH